MSYTLNERGERPWGYWKIEEVGINCIKKTIVVNAGASLSLQSHAHRSEKWEIIAGSAEVTVDGNVSILKPLEAIEIPVKAVHRLKNIGKDLLVVKETQFGEILDENDIIRYEDLYGRCVKFNTYTRSSLVFLADMDGTLTPARLPMTKSFAIFLERFISDKIFYIVSGSDYAKIQEQVPAEILNKVSGIYASMGNELYVKSKLIYQNDFNPDESLLKNLEYYRRTTEYPFELYPNYIEKRCGMINFSILGRNCPPEARAKYGDWDRQNKERETIAKELSAKYPQYDILIGGNISIDIVPEGFGKEQIADQLRRKYKTEKIVFLGDRTNENGNDYTLTQRLLILGNAEIIPVNGPEEALNVLGEKYE
ncbi:MAG: HAD-IIB family hydrolase [Holosporaceae bacterium]|jgi:HAD superfamily hydrolase (TIGR01484 family)|nr:HAD-IIB family hydrolase [Holosporaceae bacterium]